MLELQIFLKMKDFFAENFGNFWKKVVLRKISGTFVFVKIRSTSPHPPSPVANIFRKNFCFPEKIFWGALEGKGPKFWNPPPPPPTGNRLARP
jgi:hypothetical protein